jgi:hypothetical protein
LYFENLTNITKEEIEMKRYLVLVAFVVTLTMVPVGQAGTLITDITDFELTAGMFRGWDEGAEKAEGSEIFKSSAPFVLIGLNPRSLRWESLDNQRVHRYAALGLFAAYSGWQGDLREGGNVDELHVNSTKFTFGAQYHFRRVRTGLHELIGVRLGLSTEFVDGYGSDEWGSFEFENDRRWGGILEVKYTARALARAWIPKLHIAGAIESYNNGGGTTLKVEPKAEIHTWSVNKNGDTLVGFLVAGTVQYHWNSEEADQDGKRFYALGPEFFLSYERIGLVFFYRPEFRWGREIRENSYVFGLTWRI